AHLDELEISKGSLAIKNSNLEIETLVANSTNSKQMTLTSSELELVEQSDMNGDNLDLTLDASKIKFINTAVELNWDNVSWSGPFEVINSEVTINGNNSIQVLSADPGSSLILGDGSNQNFERVEKLEGESGNSLNISSSAKASITLTEHFLFCTDFLNVTNVDLNGTSIIAAGINSTVTNSADWQTQSCESVLFADFDANYLCENGFAEFTDQSNGLTTTWEWDFGDEASPNNSSSLENAFHEFSRAGLFTVNLTIGNGQQSHSVSKEVEITPTTVAKNEIAVGSDELVSASLSSAYQWFLNDERIEGATSRSYNYQGAEGVYRVVTYDGQCNRTSSLATITDLRTEETRLRVYPNPADVEIVIEFNSGPTQVSVTDLLGRVVYSSQGNSKVTLPAHQLSNGIYLLKINDGVREVIKKILVSHQN
ncbi:MAG: T9SS type A sorting domain-containing protein, partial [Cyclobacteriaceae bacterium]